MALLDKAQARRQKIKKAAKYCFRQQGLMKTSMRDIAAEAGVSLGNLYQYFPDKDALLKSFIVDNYQEIKQALSYVENSNHLIKALKALVRGYISDMDNKLEHALFLEIYAEALRDEDLFNYLQQYDDEDKLLTNILLKAQQTKQLKLAVPAQVATSSILAILESQSLKAATDAEYSQEQAMSNAWLAIRVLLNVEEQWS